MAEATKEKETDKDRSRRLMNRSVHGRVYHLKDGRLLAPGEVRDVSPAEFEKLRHYRDLCDADTIVPAQRARLDEALKENEALKKEIEELKKASAPKEKGKGKDKE